MGEYGARGGGFGFFSDIPGGGSSGGEGAGMVSAGSAGMVSAGNLGGRGAYYFFSGPKFPPRFGIILSRTTKEPQSQRIARTVPKNFLNEFKGTTQ